MNFTYKSYEHMIRQLVIHGYVVSTYCDWADHNRVVILRHDIDMCVEKAVRLAEIENKLGVRSTYFVLLTSGFYNVFSSDTKRQLCRILDLGHDIGLHYDETCYDDSDIVKHISEEATVLGNVVGKKYHLYQCIVLVKIFLELTLRLEA